MGANLYKLLGKKTRVERKDKTEGKVNLSEQHKENLDVVLENAEKNVDLLEQNIDKKAFLEGAKKAFEIIVKSYKDNNIQAVESLLAPEVYESFKEQSELQENKPNSFEMTELKASIINSDLTRNVVKIKVLFESKQKTVIKKKSVTHNIRDVWAFEKILGNNNPNWILAEVTEE